MICRLVNSRRPGRVAIEHRGDHALRREQDGKSGLAQRVGERKIVAHGTVPEFKHVALLEAFPANRRAASPAEISVVLAEIRRGGRIPGRCQRAPESAGLREKPAKRRHRAEIGIRQRRHEPREPAPAGTPVGIRKYINVESFRGLQNRRAEVVHFFSAIVRPSGNHDVNFVLAGRGDALDDFARGVVGARPSRRKFRNRDNQKKPAPRCFVPGPARRPSPGKITPRAARRIRNGVPARRCASRSQPSPSQRLYRPCKICSRTSK